MHRLFSILAFFPLLLFSQGTEKGDFYIRANGYAGFIAEHRTAMGHLIQGHVAGAEVTLLKPASGKKLWHYENNFVESGVVLAYYTLGNPSQLGQMVGIAPCFEIPLNRRKRASRVILRLAAGVAYLNKIFDPVENHKNNVASQHFNTFINFNWAWHFELAQKLRLESSINVAHASNSRLTVPNLGINIVSLGLGLTLKTKYHPVQIAPEQIDSSSKRMSKNEINFNVGYGYTMIDPPNSGRFLCQSYYMNYYRNIRNTHKIGFGFDVFHNSSNQEGLYRVRLERHTNSLDFIQAGVRVCYAYNVGRISFPVEMGVYLYDKFDVDGTFYHRVGVKYYSKQNIIVSWSLKSHWAVASYMEFGLGYRLALKKK